MSRTASGTSARSRLLVVGSGRRAGRPLQESATLFSLESSRLEPALELLRFRMRSLDDVVDVIQEEAEHVVRSMAGLGHDDMFAPIFTSTKRRAVWLGINLATAFLGAAVIGRFEDTIQQLVALAVLMPIVAGMGGVAGSQTLTIAIRGIALGQLSKSNARALMLKESAVGLLNGLMWACVVSVIVVFWFDDTSLGFIIGLAMMINFIVAAFAGAVIPMGLNRYGIDPAIAGGVLLTTFKDVGGLMIFLVLFALFLF